MGQEGGQNSVTLNVQQMPTHTHAVVFTPVIGKLPVTIPAITGSLEVTANLPVSGSNGSLSALSSGVGYLAGLAGKAGATTVTMTGPYTTTAPAAGSPSLPVTTQVTGSAGTPAVTVEVPMVTGGTVAVGNTGGIGGRFHRFSLSGSEGLHRRSWHLPAPPRLETTLSDRQSPGTATEPAKQRLCLAIQQDQASLLARPRQGVRRA